MRELRALTAEEFERARHALMNPKPGSRIAAARDYGVDLSLLVGRLKKTPAERAQDADSIARTLGPLRGIALRRAK